MESANEVDENGPLARSIIPVPRRERAATCFDPRGWFVHSKLTPGVATRRDPAAPIYSAVRRPLANGAKGWSSSANGRIRVLYVIESEVA